MIAHSEMISSAGPGIRAVNLHDSRSYSAIIEKEVQEPRVHRTKRETLLHKFRHVVHEKRFVLTRTGGRTRVAVVAPCTHGEVAILFERVVDRSGVVLVDHVDRR